MAQDISSNNKKRFRSVENPHQNENDSEWMQHEMPSSFVIAKSPSIPIKNLKRTPSEIQLRIDEEVAEMRDRFMFVRIVQGIKKQQQMKTKQRCGYRRKRDPTLEHIISQYRSEHSPSPKEGEAGDWAPGLVELAPEEDTSDEGEEMFTMDL
jgi:hypothetical protein